jgi:two-component system NtrC family sensor kinase
MSGQLAEARHESQQWAATLELRVADKSAELERAHVQLVESEKIVSLGKLAASVAHEINNPLAGILTYARLLSRNLEKERIQHAQLPEWLRWLAVIEGESRRCGSIVKNLLTFARQLPVEKKENDLNQIVDRCLMLIHHQAELQGVAISWTPTPAVARVVCDAGQTQQALLAILINAVEAMPHGGKLSIAAQDVQGAARIDIADSGPGIPRDVLPHIFEPFFTTKNQGKGTGLGLSIAFGILKQHGGRIDVKSSPDKGTTFSVFIPSCEGLLPSHKPGPVAPEVSHVA